jgi:hypothetical protein
LRKREKSGDVIGAVWEPRQHCWQANKRTGEWQTIELARRSVRGAGGEQFEFLFASRDAGLRLRAKQVDGVLQVVDPALQGTGSRHQVDELEGGGIRHGGAPVGGER